MHTCHYNMSGKLLMQVGKNASPIIIHIQLKRASELAFPRKTTASYRVLQNKVWSGPHRKLLYQTPSKSKRISFDSDSGSFLRNSGSEKDHRLWRLVVQVLHSGSRVGMEGLGGDEVKG